MPRVSLIVDVPRPQLVREGWGITRSAGTMRFGTWANGALYAGATPRSIWREPHTGILMLRPSPLRADFEENPVFTVDHFQLSDFTASAHVGTVAASRRIVTLRPDDTTPLPGVTVGSAFSAWAELRDMVFSLSSLQPLAPNSGFSFNVQPYGLADTRPDPYLAVGFGGRYLLEASTDGRLGLWDLASEARLLREFWLAGGAGRHAQPFQLTVIPWGFDALSILLTQSDTGSDETLTGLGDERRHAGLVELRRHGIDCPFDSGLSQHVKTPVGDLTVALRRTAHHYDFRISRVRFLDSGPLSLVPERIGSPRPGVTPAQRWFGFGDYTGLDPAKPRVLLSVTGPTGSEWVASSDTAPVVGLRLLPSSDGRSTPELWSVELEFAAQSETPELAPQDWSARWIRMRFRRSNRLGPERLQVTLDRRGEAPARSATSNPIEIKVRAADGLSEFKVFEGDVMAAQSELDGPPGFHVQDVVALDMWQRLEETPIEASVALEGRSLGQICTSLIRRAGFSDPNLDPDLGGLAFEGFSEVNSLRTYNAGTTVADALRDLAARFGIQGRPWLRVRWRSGAWHVGLSPRFDASTPIPAWFHLHTATLPVTGDVARWTATPQRHYLVKSPPEWSVRSPRFSGLRLSCADRTGPGAGSLWSQIDPGPGERLRMESVGPPRVGAFDQLELDRLARLLYDRESESECTLQFIGEWQPEVEPDQIVALVGLDSLGQARSYGAYRIESIDVELDSDRDADFEWTGSYALTYLGPAPQIALQPIEL